MTPLIVAGRPPGGEESHGCPIEVRLGAPGKKIESTRYVLDMLSKKTDDILWFERVGDVACY